MATTKKARTLKVVPPQVEQPADEQPQAEPELREVRHVDYDGQPLDTEQPRQPVAGVKLRRRPSHAKFIPDESDMRPIAEFRTNKTTGKLQGTYCKRCSSKLHSEYAKDHRKDQRGPTAKERIEELEQRLADTEAQLKAAEAHIEELEAARTE